MWSLALEKSRRAFWAGIRGINGFVYCVTPLLVENNGINSGSGHKEIKTSQEMQGNLCDPY